MEIVIVVLLVAILVVGATTGYVVSSRRDRGVPIEPPADDGPRGGTAVAAPEAPAEAPAPVEAPTRPRFRDRLSKARGTVGGYLSAIRSRKVDAETWDELEEALILADGFSCREQIAQGTGRRALHLAEVLRSALTPDF